MWWFHDGASWRVALGWAWSILSWVVLIGLIVFVVNRLTRHGSSEPHGRDKSDPLEIAKERYARGEITKEQFEEIKRTLSSS